MHTLDSHRGCVNTVAWNEAGTLLLSGSDDRRLIVTDPFSRSVYCASDIVIDFDTVRSGENAVSIYSLQYQNILQYGLIVGTTNNLIRDLLQYLVITVLI